MPRYASNIQIPNLPVAISLNGSEQVEIVQSGVSRRTTTEQIANLANMRVLQNVTTVEKNSLIAAPGRIVFDTNLGKVCFFDGNAWQTIVSA